MAVQANYQTLMHQSEIDDLGAGAPRWGLHGIWICPLGHSRHSRNPGVSGSLPERTFAQCPRLCLATQFPTEQSSWPVACCDHASIVHICTLLVLLFIGIVHVGHFNASAHCGISRL